MKHIIKSTEPQELTDFKALASPDWIPTYGGLTTVAKNAIKEALMQEQGYICCYCERELTGNDSHIEHFKPQSDMTVDSLDFSNMLCSCQKNIAKGNPRHCGNLKSDWYDDTLLVSPLNSACENNFGFKGDGTIYPIENALDAKTTIKKLGLNIEKLNALRESVIEPFLDDTLTDAEFISFVSGYLQVDATGKYGQFQTTIKYLFTKTAA